MASTANTGSVRDEDPSTPTPALVVPVSGAIKAASGPGCVTALYLLVAVGGVAGVVYEAVSGWPTEVEWAWWNGIHFPIAWVWGAAALMGAAAYLLRFGRGSQRTPWWSLAEYVVEGDRLRVVSRHGDSKNPGVVAGRGETIDIDAKLVKGTPKSSTREYEYRISSASGELVFRRAGYIERLSLAPLVARAKELGVTIATHGDAEQLRRG